MFPKNMKLILTISIIIVMSLGSFVLYADCDMITMLSKDGYYLSGNNSTYDLFNFIRVRSHNVQSNKRNNDGYGFIYYPENGTFNVSNQSWYQTDPTPYDDTYYTGGLAAWKVELDDAEEYIIDTVNDATIVLGHARQGSVGEGSHPFYYEYGGKTYTLMHNGTLTNDIKTPMYTYLYNLGLLNSSNWGANPAVIGTWIDSEIFFLYLMHFIESNNGNVVEGVNKALTQEFLPGLPGEPNIPDSNIKNWLENPEYYYSYEISANTYKRVANIVLSDGENLYIFRNSPSVGISTPLQDPYHNISYEEVNNIITVKTLDDLDTRVDQFDFVVISRDEDPIEYPNFLDIDIKTFASGVTWTSCPRLTEQGTSNGEIFEQAYYVDGNSGLLQEISGTLGTINGFLNILGYRDGDISIEPEGTNYIDNDEGFENKLFRHEGYKVEVAEGADPTILVVDGDRLGSYTLDMLDLEKYWLGYYIPYPQNIEDAFGDFWGDVNRVWAEDWYYDAHLIQRSGNPTQLSSNSTKGKTMEYGKMYIVDMYRDVTNFSWYGSTTAEEPTRKALPENFNYTEKADYEVIDVVSIPLNVTEIGVFEDDICVGAIAVEDSSAQILVYSDNANRDPVPFTFEIVTGRGFSTPTKDYLVLNQMKGEFEPSVIISGRQGYSAIKFGEQEEPENIISRPVLNGNYPNPFNPTTTISFSLPTEQEIELTIFNIKGQKVKTLYSGTADVGEHSIIWEGKDNNDKQVSSGIYFYKLKTNNKELTRKMLMMK